MGVIARPLPIRPMPWRLIAVAAILVLLVAATLVYVGSRRVVPPPFGLAGNGAIPIGTADGDIVTVDPATGRAAPVIGGPTFDDGPFFPRDGQRFVLQPGTSATDAVDRALDRGCRRLGRPRALRGRRPTSAGSSGRRPATGSSIDPDRRREGDDRARQPRRRHADAVPTDLDVADASWRPNHDQFVVTAKAGGNRPTGRQRRWLWQAPDPGRAVRDQRTDPVARRHEARLCDLGARRREGRIRMVDIDTGGDHTLTPASSTGTSGRPRGSRRTARTSCSTGSRQGGIDVAGGDPRHRRQRRVDRHGPDDGEPAARGALLARRRRTILATYSTAKKTLDVRCRRLRGRQAPYVATRGQTWQRRRPLGSTPPHDQTAARRSRRSRRCVVGAATSAAEPVVSQRSIAAAARLPSPIARMTVAAPRTMSPPAKTPGHAGHAVLVGRDVAPLVDREVGCRRGQERVRARPDRHDDHVARR